MLISSGCEARTEHRARIKERAGERADQTGVEQFIAQLGIDPDEYEAMTPEQRTVLLARITATMPTTTMPTPVTNGGGLAPSEDDRL